MTQSQYYFVSTNVDVQDGLLNGATDILKRIDYGTTANNTKIPKCAWIEFEHSLIGTLSSYRRAHNILLNWVRIQRVKINLSLARGRGLEIVREQISLVAANS